MNYKDLKVYQRSYKMAIEIYREVRSFPKEEIFGITSQIKRASTSIPLNIAEGFAKNESENEFKRFLLMAIGSCDEMRVLIDMSKDLGYISEEKHGAYEKEYEEIGKMLTSLRKKWQKKLASSYLNSSF